MDSKNTEQIEGKKLLVIVPTRGRPKMLKKFIQSFEKTASRDTTVLFYLDDNDPELQRYRQHIKPYPYMIGKQKTITEIFNGIATESFPDMDYYMPCNDDFIFHTKNWDLKLMDVIKKNTGSGIAFGDDKIQGQNMCTTSVISGDIVRAVGYLQMPSLTHLCGDNVWYTIGRGINRLYYLPEVVIEHNHFMNEKVEKDKIYEYTNSQSMYDRDGAALKRWVKDSAKNDVSKIMKVLLRDCKATISVCMIVADSEKPEVLKRALSSFDGWVDEVKIVFNYKNHRSFNFGKKFVKFCHNYMIKNGENSIGWQYIHFTDFSEMRNKSLEMATKDYILWHDTDDFIDNPFILKDYIMRNPEADAFKCEVHSYTEKGTKEILLHNRLFKNGKGFYFRNKLHEDVTFSMLEAGAKVSRSNIVCHHLGNRMWKDVKRKNLRNLKLAHADMEGDPHSLNYFAIVNSLMIQGGHKNNIKAIKYIDKCFEKFPPDPEKPDPLTDKMWILRGLCCQKNGQIMAAKQSFHKAYDETQSIGSAINLAELYYREEDYLKVVEMLAPIYAQDEVVINNMAVDIQELRILLVKKLADAWFEISKESKHQEDIQKAEQYYREFMSNMNVNKRDLIFLDGGDKLCQVLRNTGRLEESYIITINLVNNFPRYDVGWCNLGSFELIQKRYQTATLFLNKALSINPRLEDARHNLNMIKKAGLK